MQIEIIYLATSVEENNLLPLKYIKRDGHPKHERMEIIKKLTCIRKIILLKASTSFSNNGFISPRVT